MKPSNKLLISTAVCGLLSMTAHADEHKKETAKAGVTCPNSCKAGHKCSAKETTTQPDAAACKHAQDAAGKDSKK